MGKSIKDSIVARCERGLDCFNDACLMLRDTMLLDAKDCDTVISLLNLHLPGKSSQIAHRLRSALIAAIDVIRAEDALVKLSS
jgi:hypothetical protein